MLIMVQETMLQIMIAMDQTEDNFNQRRNSSTRAVSGMEEIVARVLLDRIEAGANFQVLKMQVKCHLKKCFKTVMTSLMIRWTTEIKELIKLIKLQDRELVLTDLQLLQVDK